LIDPDQDDVSRLILDSFDEEAFEPIQSLTVGEFREYILDDATSGADLKKLQWAIIPEMAAAAAKMMSNKDLVLAAAKIRNVTRCRNTMGEPACWASACSPTIRPTTSAASCFPPSKGCCTAAATRSSA
jgi:ethanolamine ammonia-lyase large subunit